MKAIDLYQLTLSTIASTDEHWKSFLNTAAYFSRCSFQTKALINYQRPDATAAATYDRWQQMGCQVTRGSKGIKVASGEGQRDTYVFDMKDVIEIRGHKPNLWQMTDNNREDILSDLEDRVGISNSGDTAQTRVRRIASAIASDNADNLIKAVSAQTSAPLTESEGANIVDLASDSIAYALEDRFGLLTEDEQFNFNSLALLDTSGAVDAFGETVTAEMEQAFRSVRQTLRTLYQRAREEVNHGNHEEERDRVQGGPARSALSPDRVSGDSERGTDPVRETETEIPEREQDGGVSPDADGRNSDSALSGRTASGRGNDGHDASEDDGSGRSDGRAEETESDEVGRDGEHGESADQRDHSERPDQSVTPDETETADTAGEEQIEQTDSAQPETAPSADIGAPEEEPAPEQNEAPENTPADTAETGAADNAEDGETLNDTSSQSVPDTTPTDDTPAVSGFSYDDLEHSPLRTSPKIGDRIWVARPDTGALEEAVITDLVYDGLYVTFDSDHYTVQVSDSTNDMIDILEDPDNAAVFEYASGTFGDVQNALHDALVSYKGILTYEEKDQISSMFDENQTNSQVRDGIAAMLGGQAREFETLDGKKGIFRVDNNGFHLKQDDDPWTSEKPYTDVPWSIAVPYIREQYRYNQDGFRHALLESAKELEVGDVIYSREYSYSIESNSRLVVKSIENSDGSRWVTLTDKNGQDHLFDGHEIDSMLTGNIRNERYNGRQTGKLSYNTVDNFFVYNMPSDSITAAKYEAGKAYYDGVDNQELGTRFLEALKGRDIIYDVPASWGRGKNERQYRVTSTGREFAVFEKDTDDDSGRSRVYSAEDVGQDLRNYFSYNGALNRQEVDKYFERSQAEKANYHITGDTEKVSQKERYRRNVAAIRMVKRLESENRDATANEQNILAQYTGWGGLSDAFDPRKKSWANEYNELKSLLTSEEYSDARATVLNAFYTPNNVIQSVYKAVENMGFHGGSILEPSMGVGNFFGNLPDSMASSNLTGVELDSITGRIAQKLYPNADIRIEGFEKTTAKDKYDLAIGNVPFGEYQVNDPEFNKLGFNIHNYFFAKAINEVRPGGVVAFVTSHYTMDGNNPKAREYIAKNAELLGAIRLPNDAFGAADTNVVSDIIFLKKRDTPIEDISQEKWINIGTDANGIAMNQYFVDHPEMVLGTPAMTSSRFGQVMTVNPFISGTLTGHLNEAIKNINGIYQAAERTAGRTKQSISAEDLGRQYSFVEKDGKIYFRETDEMTLATGDTARLKALIGVRDATRELIDIQTAGASDADFEKARVKLNTVYDAFVEKYGRLNDKANAKAFEHDSSYQLLRSLENFDSNGKFTGKADIFTQRTIAKAEPVTHTDTASEALAVSLDEKGTVDLPYMARLVGKTETETAKDLTGVIFKNPATNLYETADEYLSGNIRNKIVAAKNAAIKDPSFNVNVEALEKVMPKQLTASEITVGLGAPWVDAKYVQQFMNETFNLGAYLASNITVSYSPVTSEWNISGKSFDSAGVASHMTYGTDRKSGYELLEDALNLRDPKVYDTIEGDDGKNIRKLNQNETVKAANKMHALQEAFKDWVFKDPDRRDALVHKYNVLFNSTRPREYDGSSLTFPGHNPEITLKDYQKDAVAHVLFGKNTLLAHCVGAGKTYEMASAAMELKRLGLARKSMFVVPNHLLEQWSTEFLTLYPGANILTATKDDFTPANRKKFCSRIATGNYDAVIISQSQFEKIPLSAKTQERFIRQEIETLDKQMSEAKFKDGDQKFSIRSIEKSKKSLQKKLNALSSEKKKDDVVSFEELGVDHIFVDESHYYKNLFYNTKMSNVAGLGNTTGSAKALDLYLKCQYLNELTGGKGITFATGTPISNSMAEMYNVMRYLEQDRMDELGIASFDAFASSFIEKKTQVELSPTGNGYRSKTRLAKFFNLPELMSVFKEVADVKTPDMINLPVPKAQYVNIELEPSNFQKEIVKSLGQRAEDIHERRVIDPSKDNMLKVTTDGRKVALDQRLFDPSLPDDPNGKTSRCAEEAFKVYQETTDIKGTQLIFCDQSVPHGDGSFNVYDDLRQKLIDKGVPAKEIAYIHDAKTDKQKDALFTKVRSGEVRFLLGSTDKMGAGTNVQDHLVALHHLDVPWRPSDIEQQEGRILRQGNQNKNVKIFRYVTKGTFDAYSWQMIENKQRAVSQVMTSKTPARSAEDVDEAVLSYAEVKALAVGNPKIREKVQLENETTMLASERQQHKAEIYKAQDLITKEYPAQIANLTESEAARAKDVETYNQHKDDEFSITVGGTTYDKAADADKAILEELKKLDGDYKPKVIGSYRGFKITAKFTPMMEEGSSSAFQLELNGASKVFCNSGSHNVQRLQNAYETIPAVHDNVANVLEETKRQMEIAKETIDKPFPKEQEYQDKMERLAELNAELNLNIQDTDVYLDENTETKEKTPTVKIGCISGAKAGRAADKAPDMGRTKEEPGIDI